MLAETLLKNRKIKRLPWQVQFSLARLVTFGKRKEFSHLFGHVNTYCTFIGYSRSGHSLIAALLDAHPNIVIAHELRAIKYINSGLHRNALYYLLLKNTIIRGHSWQRKGGYTYQVTGQWQGAFEEIHVIGDKHGELTSRSLAANPKLFEKLQNYVEKPVKFIHVVRNPFDNITTRLLRKSQKYPDLQTAIEDYFVACESVRTLKEMIHPGNVFEIRQEDFIESPETRLHDLCLWLGVEPLPDYLSACAEIVFKSPNKSRHKIAWNDACKQAVENKMKEFEFLEEYSFDD